MRISTSMRWLVVAVSAAMLLAVAAACSSETIEVPGETVVVKEEVIKTVEVPGETVVKEVVKEVMVPGETVVVEKVVTETVEVPGQTVVVEKVVTETVEVPGETVVKEVVKEVQVPGETVVVEKEVVKTVEVPGETVVVEKEVVKTVEVPGQTVVVEKEVVKTVEVPGQTVVVEKEVVKTVEVPGPERVMVKEVAGKKYVTDPITGKAMPAPEYGGTLTFVYRSPLDTRWPDSYTSISGVSGAVLERLAVVDWSTSRATYSFGGYPPPPRVMKGALAESWEQTDDTTYVINIRKGVNWHDKAPVNGRELTAHDVEHSFHRLMGNKLTGTEFSDAKPGVGAGSLGGLPWESVTATDNDTVVMKLKEPDFWAERLMLDWYFMYIQPPELVETFGDDWDWDKVVGTGAYMMTDLVPSSSATWEKNPNYWGYDDKYPENRLPYIDRLRALEIYEQATVLAGLRTAQLDMISWHGNGHIKSIDQVVSLQKTNTELVMIPWSERSNHSHLFNMYEAPFDDVRVRRAMQMALDLDTMNDTYFRGYADTTPRGRVGIENKGYHTPFEEWSEELKGYYIYDPEGAEKLLDEAGHPRVNDGMRFKVEYLATDQQDVSYTELAAAYWRAIGLDVEILRVSTPEFGPMRNAGQYQLMGWIAGVKADPLWQMSYMWSGKAAAHIPLQDAQYDALYESMLAAPTAEGRQAITKEMDDLIIEQHWVLWGSMAPAFDVHWPWLAGYDGEHGMGSASNLVVFRYLWIDSELKNAMGH